MQVRQICKPLKKALDIQSVSLHPGTSLKHQLDGLAVRTPEIIVATPDRLCQLLAVQAFSLGSVSYVVKSFNQFSMWNLFCYIPLRHQCISSVLNE
jgi:superfamily II DNA/RNA helicase